MPHIHLTDTTPEEVWNIVQEAIKKRVAHNSHYPKPETMVELLDNSLPLPKGKDKRDSTSESLSDSIMAGDSDNPDCVQGEK